MKSRMHISTSKAGVGLRAPHLLEISDKKPDIGFFEVHSENFFARGGKIHQILKNISEHYPLSFHGVSMSLGSFEEPDKDHLKRLKELVEIYQPALVSEHIAWTFTDETHLNDLLPIPYTEEALNILCRNVDIVQNELGRQILLENPSAYLSFNLENQMTEGHFMTELVKNTNCGILLDVNNIYVSCKNMKTDIFKHLEGMPIQNVQEVHLAGHSVKSLANGEKLLVDTHSDHICSDVWELYDAFLKLHGKPVATLVEWDEEIPALEVLVSEANKATSRLQKYKVREDAA